MRDFFRTLFRFQESGLLLVILALGILLTVFSGSVRLPVFETNPDGTRQRVFITNEQGERVPQFVEKNKFFGDFSPRFKKSFTVYQRGWPRPR